VKTERLYYTDAYRADFTADVVERSDDGLRVYLSETAFYPTSGGQLHDLGTLAGIHVVDVVDEDERVAHVLSAALPASTGTVAGVIDWVRRYDHMQQHTGQHLLSAVLEDLFGLKTVSVHFGPDYSTLDVDGELVSHKQLLSAEARANAVVGQSRPVTVSFEDAAEAAGLRKSSERTGTLRIVSIEGIDRSACGGTHIRSTAEIGAVLLRSTEKIRKATRIEFVCGARAVARARRDFETLGRVASSLSASIDDVGGLVTAQAERAKESDNERKRLEKELAGYRVRERYDAAVPDSQGVRMVVIRDAASMDDLRALAQAAFALPKVLVIGALATPPSLLIASSEDSGVDAGKSLKGLLATVGGRGGGSPRLAQGSVPSADAIDGLVTALRARG
jgi:alanyl-tRNA synthetase